LVGVFQSSRSARSNAPDGLRNMAMPRGVSSWSRRSGRLFSMTSPRVVPSKSLFTLPAYGFLKTSRGEE